MSGSSSSSSQLQFGQRRTCFCHMPAIIVTSWTPKNPSRRFFGCQNYFVGKACDFFEWLDDKICARGKMVILPLRNENLELHARILQYQEKIAYFEQMEKKMKEYESMEKKVKEYEEAYKITQAKLKAYEERDKRIWKGMLGLLLCIGIVVVVKSVVGSGGSGLLALPEKLDL